MSNFIFIQKIYIRINVLNFWNTLCNHKQIDSLSLSLSTLDMHATLT